MLMVGSWDWIDGIAGAVAAVAAATIAESARRAAQQRPRAPLDRLRAVPAIPLVIVADFGLLTYALAVSLLRRRSVRGRYLARDFAAGPRTTPGGAAHRAWTVLLGGYSPNAYVVDIDPDENVVLVHDLVPWRRSETPA
jgi:hypothetical protein